MQRFFNNNIQRISYLQRHFCKKIVMEAPNEPRVLYRDSENKKFCEVTFNNPKALNAFDIHMANSLTVKVAEWEKNNTQVVLFKGAGGKAFCAGGDVKT